MGWEGPVESMDETRNAYKCLVGKPEWDRPLVRPGSTCEDNIKRTLWKMILGACI